MTQRHGLFTWQRFFAAALLLVAQSDYAADPAQRLVRIGFVSQMSSSTNPRGVNAFWERLRELGYLEGQNLLIEARWADGHNDRLPGS